MDFNTLVFAISNCTGATGRFGKEGFGRCVGARSIKPQKKVHFNASPTPRLVGGWGFDLHADEKRVATAELDVDRGGEHHAVSSVVESFSTRQAPRSKVPKLGFNTPRPDSLDHLSIALHHQPNGLLRRELQHFAEEYDESYFPAKLPDDFFSRIGNMAVNDPLVKRDAVLRKWRMRHEQDRQSLEGGQLHLCNGPLLRSQFLQLCLEDDWEAASECWMDLDVNDKVGFWQAYLSRPPTRDFFVKVMMCGQETPDTC